MKIFKKKTKQVSESFLLATLLAIVGGYLDAYTYIARGGVFANAQTGNMVLLALGIAEKNWLMVFYYSVPIAAFSLGVIFTECIRTRFKTNSIIHWRQIIIAFEILLLLIMAFIPQGRLDVIVNVTVSFVCAVQVQGFRKVNGNAVATTMCTGNLRSATEKLYNYFQHKEVHTLAQSLQYCGIIIAFILGALIGTLCTNRFGIVAILISCSLLLIVLMMMNIKEKTQ